VPPATNAQGCCAGNAPSAGENGRVVDCGGSRRNSRRSGTGTSSSRTGRAASALALPRPRTRGQRKLQERRRPVAPGIAPSRAPASTSRSFSEDLALRLALREWAVKDSNGVDRSWSPTRSSVGTAGSFASGRGGGVGLVGGQ
jgi:hypothetical protein